jgi:hypothetical protein
MTAPYAVLLLLILAICCGHVLTHLILKTSPFDECYCNPPYLMDEDKTEGFSDLSTITWLI